MLSRETSDWSLKRRSDGLGEEEFEDFEEDKDLDEDFDDELDEDELEEEDLDDLDEYDDLDDEFDDEDEEDFRPRKARRELSRGSRPSALQQVELVNHQAVFVVPHQGDDDGQSHSRFRGGHCDGKDDEH